MELEAVRGSETVVEEARVELRGDELTVKVERSKAEVRLRVRAPEGSALRARRPPAICAAAAGSVRRR